MSWLVVGGDESKALYKTNVLLDISVDRRGEVECRDVIVVGVGSAVVDATEGLVTTIDVGREHMLLAKSAREFELGSLLIVARDACKHQLRKGRKRIRRSKLRLVAGDTSSGASSGSRVIR